MQDLIPTRWNKAAKASITPQSTKNPPRNRSFWLFSVQVKYLHKP
jgi:hypothetical protein